MARLQETAETSTRLVESEGESACRGAAADNAAYSSRAPAGKAGPEPWSTFVSDRYFYNITRSPARTHVDPARAQTNTTPTPQRISNPRGSHPRDRNAGHHDPADRAGTPSSDASVHAAPQQGQHGTHPHPATLLRPMISARNTATRPAFATATTGANQTRTTCRSRALRRLHATFGQVSRRSGSLERRTGVRASDGGIGGLC